MQDFPVGDQMMLLSLRSVKYPRESRSPCFVEQVPDPLRVLLAQPAGGAGGPEEQVGGDGQREQAEGPGQHHEQVAVLLGHEVDRAGHPHQAVHHMHDPLPQRVVLGQPPGQQDVREPDGHIGHHQPEEDPQRTPPGPRVAHRVELTPEVQQGAHQQRRDGRGDDPVLPERDHVHHDADREQQRHRLPGAPLPPLQAVGEHQQQQADDDGDGVRDVDQRARHELVDPGQVGGVDQAGPDDLDDVGQADQEAQPACRDRHPAPLVPAVGRPRGGGRRAPPGRPGERQRCGSPPGCPQRSQPPGQQDVREPDGHVGHHQPEEDPQRTPPGPRVAHRVELTPEVQQGAHQQRRDGRGHDPVLPERDHVHHDAGREQQRHRPPGAPFPPFQGVGEHQQQQADDDGDGVRDVDQRARHEGVEPGQVGGVDQAGPDDLDDVGQADQEAQPACRDRHPAPLVPAIGRPRGQAPPVSVARLGGTGTS